MGSKYIVPLKLLEINQTPSLPDQFWHKLYYKNGYLKTLKTSEKDVVLDRPLDNFTLGPCLPITAADTVLQAFQKLQCQISIIPPQVNADWNATTGPAFILNKPTLFSGDYNDLINAPVLAPVATSGDYNDLTNTPAPGVQSVTGLDTDNTDPLNPVVRVAVDGVTITGDGTPSDPLVANTILPPGLLFGLFTQIDDSTPITNTLAQSSLLGTGLGSLSVPANGFQQGDSFKFHIGGDISSKNNTELKVIVKSGSTILAETGTITMPQTTNKHWELVVYFTVRQVGSAGVASIVSTGGFTYSKDAASIFEGVNFSTVNNTTFDTTILNTLEVEAAWGDADVLNNIYSEVATLVKTY
jgi:hypothetical protein